MVKGLYCDNEETAAAAVAAATTTMTAAHLSSKAKSDHFLGSVAPRPQHRLVEGGCCVKHVCFVETALALIETEGLD